MVIGPDKGDLPVMRKLCRETGCDVWFPFYPLCMEHCISVLCRTLRKPANGQMSPIRCPPARRWCIATVCPTSFKVDFVGQPYEGACYYRITRCPICIYAEKLGVSELMPLFCELDEVMITLQHGVLHRKQTLANGGEYCDYFITGNRE